MNLIRQRLCLRVFGPVISIALMLFTTQAQASWFFIFSEQGESKCQPLRDNQTPEIQIRMMCGSKSCPLTTETLGGVQYKSVEMPDGEKLHFANSTEACARVNRIRAAVRQEMKSNPAAFATKKNKTDSAAELPKAQVPQSPSAWWSVNSDHSECLDSRGPAAKLDSFVGFTDRPITRDFKDSVGKLTKVEVINYEDQGRTQRVWTYYKSKTQCESEGLNATKSLADKYR